MQRIFSKPLNRILLSLFSFILYLGVSIYRKGRYFTKGKKLKTATINNAKKEKKSEKKKSKP